ncbi:MAG: DNA primase [Clostridia bacterium]|nr:DNA primase [Clostridia bacterium]
MAWSEEFKEKVKESSDIVEVISSYVPLKRVGRSYMGVCPFHSDKKPSMSVNPDMGFFNCFGCRTAGDVIKFVMLIENITFKEAVERLAARSGIPIPEGSYEDSGKRELKKRVLEMNREAARFYYGCLYSPSGVEGLAYLKEKRLLTDDTIRHYGLGFSPNSWSALTDYLASKGFGCDELVTANLSIQTSRGGYIDRFRNRVMFPIINTRGEVIAFGGRTMGGDDAKYLNSSDTPVYKKTDNLYCMNFAAESRADMIIVCEGYMDVIALGQAGFDNAVAGLGTALTDKQAALAAKRGKRIVLCYDSDTPGQNAAAKAIIAFEKQNADVYVMKVPDGKDPDEYIKHHGANGYIKFKALAENALEAVDFYREYICSQHDMKTVNGKWQALSQAAEFIANIPSATKRDIYSSKISDDTGIRKGSLNAAIDMELRKLQEREAKIKARESKNTPSGAYRAQAVPYQAEPRNYMYRLQSLFIAFLMMHPEYMNAAMSRLPIESVRDTLLAKTYSIIAERAVNGMSVRYQDIAEELGLDDGVELIRIINEYYLCYGSVAPNDVFSDLLANIDRTSKLRPSSEVSKESDDNISYYIKQLSQMKKNTPQ